MAVSKRRIRKAIETGKLPKKCPDKLKRWIEEKRHANQEVMEVLNHPGLREEANDLLLLRSALRN